MNLNKKILPLCWIIVGVSIMASPEGRLLQMPIGVGDWKYLLGTVFVIVGVVIWFYMKKRNWLE